MTIWIKFGDEMGTLQDGDYTLGKKATNDTENRQQRHLSSKFRNRHIQYLTNRRSNVEESASPIKINTFILHDDQISVRILI